MPASEAVDANQTIDSSSQGLLRPAALRHVVIHDSPDRVNGIHHPARVAERGHEEAHPLLEGNVHPAPHPALVHAARLLDEGVEADGLAGCRSNLPYALAQVVAVRNRQADRLNDPEASRLTHRGHQLGVATGVHCATDQRHLDPGLLREGRPHRTESTREASGGCSCNALPP